MAISIDDLRAVAARTRSAALAAGELRPGRVGPIRTSIPEDVAVAVAEDLASGEYRRAADEAIAGDPDLAQP